MTQPDHEKKDKPFKIQIDKQQFEVNEPTITGRRLLELAGKTPVEQFAVYLKVHGGQPERLQLDTVVDLREPGKERFLTLPLDQTEGLGERRAFVLPADDIEWLHGSGLCYELVAEGGVQRVVLREMPVPGGYNVPKVDVNLRIDTGYPDTQIDMAYFFPSLQRLDGRAIDATSDESFDGRVWQRWSRHRTGANPWRPGVDNLSTHMAAVQEWLVRELKKRA